MAAVLMFVPFFAFAQFRDLDTALSNLNRGFGGGDVQAIVAGIDEGGKVRLQRVRACKRRQGQRGRSVPHYGPLGHHRGRQAGDARPLHHAQERW
jgi:hypothetical protein